MHNFVYCIDKKFNLHAYLSIVSLLKSTSENISIYIIHKSPRSFVKYKKLLYKFFPNCKLYIIKFKFNIKKYPNLKNSHVSEATYYRMFISDHIEENIEYITYLDADAYIVKDPTESISQYIKKMKNENKILSALSTNFIEEEKTRDIFNRLQISHKYFNAGVMILNVKEWKKQKISNNFKKLKDEISDSILYWDQDILNKYFDGDYVDLSSSLNYLVNLEEDKKISGEIEIFHFVGKNKPWNTDSYDNEFKSFYDSLKYEFI